MTAFDLEQLLAPLAPERFLARHWEKEALVIARRNAAHYDGLLSLPAVDDILAQTDLHPASLRLVRYRDGGTREALAIPLRRDGHVDVDALYAAFADGATLVLNGLHRNCRPLLALCRRLEQRFGHPFQTNVYLTPPAAQGLGPHFDTHDVFVLQIAGRKEWALYAAAEEAPLAAQYRQVGRAELGTPTATFVLEPGGLIYIPCGTAHEARTSEDTSLHITLGMLSLCWRDALRAAVDVYCRQTAPARHALPLGFADDPEARAAAMSGLGAWLERMAAELETGVVIDALAEAFVQDRAPLLGGCLGDLVRLEEMSARTRVRRRAGIICRLDREEDRAVLKFHDKSVLFPDFVRASLEHLVAGGAMQVGNIPGGLDAPGRLVLARRLVREGFLEIVDI